MPRQKAVIRAIAFAGLVSSTPGAQAADTVETFDRGAVDVELYTGAEGLGLGEGKISLVGEALLGYGIVDRFSAYVRSAMSANHRLEDGNGEAAIGIFGTPLDAEHVDLDLQLDVGWTPGSALITPAVELNLDAQPDLALLGLYARVAESLATREEPLSTASTGAPSGASATAPAPCATVLAPTTVFSLGSYWTMVEGHQLLLQADACAAHRPAEDEPSFDFRGIALGYNFAAHETIELITQVFVDVPIREGDSVSAGVSIGLIGSAQIVAAGHEASSEPTALRVGSRFERDR